MSLFSPVLKAYMFLFSLSGRGHKTAYLTAMFLINVYVHIENVRLKGTPGRIPFATIAALFGNFGFLNVYSIFVLFQCVAAAHCLATNITDHQIRGTVISNVTVQENFRGKSENVMNFEMLENIKIAISYREKS